MTQQEIYEMGRADYLNEVEGKSLTEGSKQAKKEWDEMNGEMHLKEDTLFNLFDDSDLLADLRMEQMEQM